MRRTVGLAASLTILVISAAAQSPNTASGKDSKHATPILSDREMTADQQVMQVLNRLGFGPRPGDAAKIRQIGVDTWVDRQLHPELIGDTEMDQLVSGYTFLSRNQNELARDYADFVQTRLIKKLAKRDTANTTDNIINAEDSVAFKQMSRERVQLLGQLQSARVARAVGSQRQLLEVMTDFWENHFNVYVRKGGAEPYYLVDYDRNIRAHALGKFRDLLGVVAHSPAMLFYLDNAQSRANPGQPTLAQERARRRLGISPNAQQNNKKGNSGLNENYGRELLELHTLGVDGGYTQHDVIDVARAFTGWSIEVPKQGGGFIFRPLWHDAEEKTVLGHKLRAGRGEEDGEEVLDIIARHPSTAHFIALKLARRFVSDSPSTMLVDRAAQTFLRTDGDIREVIRTLVTSSEFFSARVYRAKVKSPFEVVVSAARALDAPPDKTVRTALAVAYLGQPLFGHQAPDGWPESGEAWINTGAILNRINFGMAVAANRLPGASFMNLPGADSLLRASREHQVDAVIQSVLGGSVSADMRRVLLSGEHPLAADATKMASDSAPTSTVDVSTADANDVDPGSDALASSQIDSAMNNAAIQKGAKQNGRQKRKDVGRAGIGTIGWGPPPKLSGFAQVVGLAIGSPEFQRR